jgi:redox-sensitive bicupin YhaK (pirin superfamily)
MSLRKFLLLPKSHTFSTFCAAIVTVRAFSSSPHSFVSATATESCDSMASIASAAAEEAPVPEVKATIETGPPREFVSRPVQLKILSREQGEGVGARVRRSIGGGQLRQFDPFLLLDEFKVGLPGGFPDHPHRGFETVTFLLPDSEGQLEHEDFKGHRGLLDKGGLQWMTAGKGIYHAEMPVTEAPAHGLQLWVNLKSSDKLVPPRYQELSNENVTKVKKDGVLAHVIAGSALGVTSEVKTLTPTNYLYFEMEPNSVLHQPVAPSWNAFIYTLSGKARFGSKLQEIGAHHTITFESAHASSGVTVKTGDVGVKFVLIAGEPIGEPVAQHGPVVMNTREELMKAFDDIQRGKDGFEGAANWHSEIRLRSNSY